jgi:hypothetical protein
MTETELVNAKGFRYGATACQDAASLMGRIAAKPPGPDIGVLCMGPGQPTRWGAGRFRMGDARPSAGAGIIEGGWRRADRRPKHRTTRFSRPDFNPQMARNQPVKSSVTRY